MTTEVGGWHDHPFGDPATNRLGLAPEEIRDPDVSAAVERSVIGAMLVAPETVSAIRAHAPANVFAVRAHRRIVRAIYDGVDRGETATAESLAQRLTADDSSEYLHQLCTDARDNATIASVTANALLLAKLHRRRELADAALKIRQKLARREDVTADEIDRMRDLVQAKHCAPTLRPIDLVIRSIAKGHHIATHLETFDRATRGGPRLGDVVVVGGAPAAGKTTLLCNHAVAIAADGVRVGILAVDESAQGLAIRIGQMLGQSRDDLEAADEIARERAAAHASALPLLIADATDGATVESVADELLRTANGAPAVLFIDSLQTAPALGTDTVESARERIDAVMSACKRAAARGLLVFASSELARGAYRSREAAQNTDPLAAFKESGGIEYGATAALVIRPVRDSDTDVDVVFAKNRIGERLEFRLRLDRERARFYEVPVSGEGEGGEREAAAAKSSAKLKEMCERIVHAIATAKVAPTTRDAIKEIVTGDSTVIDRAITMLIGTGRIVGGRGTAFTANGHES